MEPETLLQLACEKESYDFIEALLDFGVNRNVSYGESLSPGKHNKLLFLNDTF